MNASKENAKKARDLLHVLAAPALESHCPHTEFIEEFLATCERDLPTDGALEAYKLMEKGLEQDSKQKPKAQKAGK